MVSKAGFAEIILGTPLSVVVPPSKNSVNAARFSQFSSHIWREQASDLTEIPFGVRFVTLRTELDLSWPEEARNVSIPAKR